MFSKMLTPSEPAGQGIFPETQWSVINRAKTGDEAQAFQALGFLCERYRPVLRSQLLQWGKAPDEVEDLLHEFLEAKVLRGQFFASVHPGRGRFRTFLRTCLKNFLRSKFRDGRNERFTMARRVDTEWEPDDFASTGLPPDRLMERSWAQCVLDNAQRRLLEEAALANKTLLCETLLSALSDEPDAQSYREIGKRFGLTENNVSVTAFRFRERLRFFIQDEVRQTVAADEDWRDELRQLALALKS